MDMLSQDENAAGNTIVKEEDFRVISSNDTPLNKYVLAKFSEENICLSPSFRLTHKRSDAPANRSAHRAYQKRQFVHPHNA